MSALDDAIAAHLAHPAASGFDPLTDSLGEQCGASAPLNFLPASGLADPFTGDGTRRFTPVPLREGWEHERIDLPITPRWALLALLVLLLTLLLSACGGGDCDDDDTKNTGPVDCRAHPEQCR